MSRPTVSVIICVRNGEKYIRDALNSIEHQGHSNLEVVVIDGASGDGSVKAAQDHPLNPRVVAQEELGQGAALNEGFEITTGDLLAFLDCDDVWPRGRLAAMLATLGTDPGLDFVFGKTVNTDAHLKEIGAPIPARLLGAMLIKRTAALRVGKFRNDIAHGAIVDWNSRAAALDLKSCTIDHIVLLRRIHGNNLGIRERPQARVDLLRMLREHRTRQQ